MIHDSPDIVIHPGMTWLFWPFALDDTEDNGAVMFDIFEWPFTRVNLMYEGIVKAKLNEFETPRTSMMVIAKA